MYTPPHTCTECAYTTLYLHNIVTSFDRLSVLCPCHCSAVRMRWTMDTTTQTGATPTWPSLGLPLKPATRCTGEVPGPSSCCKNCVTRIITGVTDNHLTPHLHSCQVIKSHKSYSYSYIVIGHIRLTIVHPLSPVCVQVTISALNLQFQPNKLARSVEEAKLTAAEYTLTQIGFPVDGVCVHDVRGWRGQ